MLIDGLKLLGTSTAENFSVASGDAFPTDINSVGELFFLTSGDSGLYVYDGSDWVKVGTGSGGNFDLSTHSINELQDVDTSTYSPNFGDVLTWNGGFWYPQAVQSNGAETNTFLDGTGDYTYASGDTGVFAGLKSNGTPQVLFSHGGATAGTRLWVAQAASNGQFSITPWADSNTVANSGGLVLSRNGTGVTTAALTTLTSISLTAPTINLGANASVTTAGAVAAGSFTGSHSGDGSNLTALNATNISAGIVGTARLGTGTADNTTYLRGDGTWATPSISSTSLAGTGLSPRNYSTPGFYAGVDGGADPVVSWINSNAAAGKQVWQQYVTDDGIWRFALSSDNGSTTAQMLTISRTANVANTVAWTTDAFTISGTLSASSFSGSLNASQLSSGTVPTARMGTGTADNTTYLRGDGTWATPTATITALNATTDQGLDTSASNVRVGVTTSGSNPIIQLTHSGAGTNGKNYYARVLSSGNFELGTVTDAGATPTPFFTTVRSGNALTSMTLAATTINLTGAVVGTSFAGTHTGTGTGLTALNASNLGSGIVPTARLGTGTADATTYLRGDNTWQTLSAAAPTTLSATDASPRSGTVGGVYAGMDGTPNPILTLTNAGATANNRVVQHYITNDGLYRIALSADNFTSSTVFAITRSGNTATKIETIATNIALTGAVTGNSFTGIGSGLTSLTAANLSGIVPTANLGTGTANSTTYLRGDGTWQVVTSGSTLPSQTGNSGKFLTTDGTNTSWGALSGDGSAITNMNASNLATGTVGTARLGTGTASGTTYLRGDGTWATVTATVTQIPRTTTFDASAKGGRVALTAGVTIPSGTYSPGDVFSFYNTGSTPLTITQGVSLTLRQDGTTNTGDRTLLPYGTCSIWFNTANEAVISGSVL